MEAKFTISEAFKTSWKCVKSQIWVLAGLLIGYTIISLILSLLTGPTQGSWAGEIIVTIINIVIACIFSLGYTKNMFQALDGEEPQFSAYGQESRKIIKYFIAEILFTIIFVIGLCLLIIPGIYIALRLQFFTAFIVEDNAGIVESFKRSWAITKGQGLPLFWVLLTQIGITLVGLILFVIGIFIAIPVIYMMYCYIYRKLVALETTPATEEQTTEENSHE
jgi:hypothetical protein